MNQATVRGAAHALEPGARNKRKEGPRVMALGPSENVVYGRYDSNDYGI